MKYPTLRLIYDRRKKSDEAHKGYIELEISLNYKRKWLSTGVAVLPKQWDQSKGVIHHPDSMDLNIRIESVRRPIAEYINRLMLKGEEFTFDKLDAEICKNKSTDSFIDFVAQRIESRTDIKEITRKNHRRLNTALSAYGKIKTFKDLTPQTIRDFDAWLHTQNYTQSTVAVYHKFMKNYIHLAMADELINFNPYAGIRIDKGKHKQRKYLTEDELRRVRDFVTDDPSSMRARDLFLFQCFTGLAYVDMEKFDFNKVVERNGKYIIRDVRHKSEEEFYIVLLSPAMEILRKYNFKLPVISNQKYNSALKAVAAGAGIRFNVTSHCGRHTFATYCLNHGVPIETLASMLGHSNIKATQIYARMINKTVESAFDNLENSLNI